MSLFKHNDPNNLINAFQDQRVDTMIGIPSWQGGLEPDTQICLDQLCGHNVRENNLVTIKKSRGSMISENRNNIIRAAIEANCKYLLLVDTDMVFPVDAIQQMKKHGKGVVSGLAHSKGAPYVPNMYQRVGRAGWKAILDWSPGSLVKADCVGGAFMLIDVDILRRIDPPWFASPSMKEHVVWPQVEDYINGKIDEAELGEKIKKAVKEVGFGGRGWKDMPVLGEDYYFSEHLRRQHIPIWVDTALKIGHVGKYTFGFRDFEAHKKAGTFDDEIQKFGFGVREAG